jgi:uncharacterized membrane protein required for colicin V production
MVSYIPKTGAAPFPGNSRARFVRRLIWCAILFGPAVYFGREGDYVVAAVSVIAIVSAFSGYFTGAAWMLASLVGIGAAFTFAPSLGYTHEMRFSEWFGTTGLTNRFMSVGIVGILISTVVALVLMKITGRMIESRRGLESFNRFLGFGIGAVQGPAAVLFLLGGFLVIESMEQERAGHLGPSVVADKPLVSKLMLKTNELTHESLLGPTIVEYNPFTRIPQLDKLADVQRSVQVLSDPAQIEGVLNHPSIRELQERPAVKHAVEQLRADESIQEVLRSGKRMDRSMAMILLSHPAVLELIDQPGFLKEASRIINGARLLAR